MYSRSWRNTLPSRGTPSDLIDEEIRQVRTDFQERLESVGIDLTTNNTTVTQTRHNFVHWSRFIKIGGNWTGATLTGTFGFGVAITNQVTGQDFYFPITTARGVTLDEVSLIANVANGTVGWEIYRVDAATNAKTSHASGTLTAPLAAGEHLLTGSDLTIDDNPNNFYLYHLKITVTPGNPGSITLYGVHLKYGFTGKHRV